MFTKFYNNVTYSLSANYSCTGSEKSNFLINFIIIFQLLNMAHITLEFLNIRLFILWHFDTTTLHNSTKHIFIYTWIIIYFQQCHSDIILLNMSPLPKHRSRKTSMSLGAVTNTIPTTWTDKIFGERRKTITFTTVGNDMDSTLNKMHRKHLYTLLNYTFVL